MKVKSLHIWTRFLGKLKGFQNIVMLAICLNEKSFRCKKKKKQQKKTLLFLKS